MAVADIYVLDFVINIGMCTGCDVHHMLTLYSSVYLSGACRGHTTSREAATGLSLVYVQPRHLTSRTVS